MKEKINFSLKIPKTLKVVGKCDIHNCDVYQCTGESRNECSQCDVSKICNNGRRCGRCEIEWLANQGQWKRQWRMNHASLIKEKEMEIRSLAMQNAEKIKDIEDEIAENKKFLNDGPTGVNDE